jgi:hypothetical protein
MSNFEPRVKFILSQPFIAAVPASARPPHGHFVLTELATIAAATVSDATLGKIGASAMAFSHYEVASEEETINLDDFAKLLRQRSPFAIDKKCPVAELSRGSEGGYIITPLVRAGQGKRWDSQNAITVSDGTDFQSIGSAIRAALQISAVSVAVT